MFTQRHRDRGTRMFLAAWATGNKPNGLKNVLLKNYVNELWSMCTWNTLYPFERKIDM